MAKKRADKKGGDGGGQKSYPRTGAPVNVWIDEQLADALQAYLDGTEPRVSKTAAVESALRAFLREQGFWPPGSTPPAKD